MDKIKFAKNYRIKQEMFNNINKSQKQLSVGAACLAAVITAFSIINPLVLFTLLIEGVIVLPLVGFSQYRKHEIIKECNNGCGNPIPYKEFKKMLKSGEIEKLIQQVRVNEQKEFNEHHKKAFIDVVEKSKPYSISPTTSKYTVASNNSANHRSSFNKGQSIEL